MHVTSLKKSVGYSFINTSTLLQKLPIPSACNALYFGCFGGGCRTVDFFFFQVGQMFLQKREVRTQPKLVKMHFAFQGTLVCTVCVFIHLCHAGQGYKKLICFQCHFLMYLLPWHCFKAPLLRWHLFSRLPFHPFDVFPIWTWLKLQNVCIPVCLLVTCAERQDIKIFQ